ncbi:MAG: 5'-nucleotidase C-terminal domain-containing protein, partial [Microcystis sp.]
ATFTFNGQEVTVINNHLSSRRGGNGLFGNVQPPNIGGADVRANQATVINSEVNAILADDPNANVVVLGDFNGFDFEEFQQILSGGVLTNLSQTLDVRDRATFNFQGNSQALDHILITNNLASKAEYDIVRVNVDFLDQPADHEPILATLILPFTLQILQASDQEAGIPAFQDILGFSAVMNALDNKYTNTLKLTTGDVYISSPFFNASRDIYDNATTGNPQADQGGIADILINNELGWDVASVGNHEFSGGAGSFLNLVAPNPNWVNGQNGGVGIGPGGYPGAAFPYLANNLDYSRATLPNGLAVVANGGAPLPNTLTGSVVKDFNGEKVGIIGIVTPYLKSIADTGAIEVMTRDSNGNVITGTTSVDVQVDSIIRNITPEVQALSNAGINKIILMTHLQESRIEIALAEEMAALGLGVDLLFGGGSHQQMSSSTGVPPLREDETQQNNGQLLQPFPQVYGGGDNRVIYVNSAANYRYLNQLVVTFDDRGVITTIGDDSGPYATDIAGVDRLYDESITTFDQVRAKADPDIVEIVDGVRGFVDILDGTIFGQTDVFLNGVRGDVRTQETNLGNLTADAQDFYAEAYLNEHNLLPGFNRIDISFTNGGSIRDQIGRFAIGDSGIIPLPPQANPDVGKEEGDISQLDISNSLRFDGDIVVGTVNATGFLQLAEHMISSVETGNGRFGQIGGFNFSYDPNAPTSQRIRSLALADATGNSVQTIVKNGELVVASNTVFSVVTQGFLANGGDSYPTVIQNIQRLTDFDEPDSLGNANLRPGRIQDAFAEYLSAFYNNEKGQQPFNQADTPQSEDQRIQSLGFRQDTVLNGITPLPTTINGTTGDDIFDAAARDGKQFIGNNQILNTGSGNDTVNVRFAVGGNNIRTASGNDIVYAGTNNRIDTGVGNDLLFLGSAGGNNIVTGGSGQDLFWITENDALLPANTNIIADYRANQGDLIGFFSTSLSFGSRGTNWDYRQAGANTIIEAFGRDVAILNGINASTLTQANFTFG